MHVNALKARIQEEKDQELIYHEMQCISVFNPKPGSLLNELSKVEFLPIRQPSGTVIWLSPSSRTSFAIIDRLEHENIFRSKLCSLNFSMEEIHPLKAFLLALDLEDRYTSHAAKETTEAKGGIHDSALSENLSLKAYAIARYAAHLDAPDPVSIFSALKEAEVFISDSITKVIRISQNGKSVAARGTQAHFHVEKDDEKLKLYLPHDVKKRRLGLARHMPTRLLNHFSAPRSSEASLLGTIIVAPDLDEVDLILEDDGIIKVPGIERPSGHVSVPDLGLGSSPWLLQSLAGALQLPHRSTSHKPSYYFPTDPYPDETMSREAYKGYLSAVVRQASQITTIPIKNERVTAQENVYISEFREALESRDTDERNVRIGVAGELFVRDTGV